MTLQEFTRDIVPLIQLLLGVAGLVSLILLWLQIRETTRWNKQTTLWNKLRTQQTFLSTTTLKLQEEMQQTAKNVGVILKLRKHPLTDEEYNKILDNDEAYHALMRFLNDMETTCTAINIGIVDPDVAYSSHGIIVMRYYRIYWPVIEKVRKHYESDDIMTEFQKLAVKWIEKEKRIKEERELKRKQEMGLEPKLP